MMVMVVVVVVMVNEHVNDILRVVFNIQTLPLVRRN